MRNYPALDVTGADPELVMAVVDDFAPSAVDEQIDTLTIYFTESADRDRARAALAQQFPLATLSPREVDDGDWAKRSQEDLQPITVGRVTVAPPWAVPEPQPPTSNLGPLTIVILPSMGFGTGHHATTRLCLAALQTLELAGREMLDVGTGSGVLAMAARRLGAGTAVGLDYDADAIQSANENLELNPFVDGVHFRTIDLRAQPLPSADIVTANLTGALLVETAPLLVAPLRPGGALIVSGLQVHEREAVERAFSVLHLVWAEEESGWLGMIFNRPPLPTV